jgi:Tol biopolymer transport system component
MRYDSMAHTWTESVDANAAAIHGSYTTFAPVGNPFPTDDQSAAIVSMAYGTLALYDPDSGAALPANLDVATHGPNAPRSALMADWSPDGTRVVFASTPHSGQWIDLSDSSIAMMSYAYTGGQHVFGEPQFLIDNPITLQSGTYTSFFFPSFSPDGALIIFNAARGAWRNVSDARSPGQRLFLIDSNNTWGADLTALNGSGDNDITWPHWAPTVSNDYYWVVFASERDYGHRVTAANSAPSCIENGVHQCKQLWIGAIAKNKLGTADPSAPPMWLPGQDTQTDNISPYWSVPAGIK